MKNEPIILPDGTKFYRNRGIGVVMLAFIKINRKFHVLCNKRGARTSEAALLWNLPSGYLDWDESGEDAAVRETLEECGIDIPLPLVHEVEHSTSPKENRQNIIFRYLAILPSSFSKIPLIPNDPEEDEVREVKWIPIDEINNYNFAWNQLETIKRIFNTYINK